MAVYACKRVVAVDEFRRDRIGAHVGERCRQGRVAKADGIKRVAIDKFASRNIAGKNRVGIAINPRGIIRFNVQAEQGGGDSEVGTGVTDVVIAVGQAALINAVRSGGYRFPCRSCQRAG